MRKDSAAKTCYTPLNSLDNAPKRMSNAALLLAGMIIFLFFNEVLTTWRHRRCLGETAKFFRRHKK